MDEPVLVIKDLGKSFRLSAKQKKERGLFTDRLVAVNDLSLSFQGGKIYGLLGPNGAGKTTTLRMLATLLTPDKGEIFYRGEDIHKNVAEYRKKVGFLTSELKLDDFFTPTYTFMYMAELYGIPKEEAETRREAVFKEFGVDRFASTQIKYLSTGMKQKASLAISIAHDPEVIIYDEPTNGLDILASRDVENFLLRLKGQGKAVIISTHIFSLIEKLCDEVGIILNGTMRREGPLKDITKDKSLEDVFFSLIQEEDQ